MHDITLNDEELQHYEKLKKYYGQKGFRNPQEISEIPEKIFAYASLFPSGYVYRDIIDISVEKSKIDSLKEIVNSPNSKEQDILRFFKKTESLNILSEIFKRFSTGHHEQYIFNEFALPNKNHIADFLLIGKSSDGYHEIFVEFEAVNTNKSSKIFTKKGGEGSILRNGREQVQSWEDSINKQHQAHVDNLRSLLGKNQILPNELQINLPKRRHYVVVAGRRDDYKEYYDQRLSIQHNNQIQILHYDRIIEDFENKINKYIS